MTPRRAGRRRTASQSSCSPRPTEAETAPTEVCFDTGLVARTFSSRLGCARPPRSLRRLRSGRDIRADRPPRQYASVRSPSRASRVLASAMASRPPSCSSTPTTICLNISMPPGSAADGGTVRRSARAPIGGDSDFCVRLSTGRQRRRYAFTCLPGAWRGGFAGVAEASRSATVDDRAQRRANYGWSAPGERVTVDEWLARSRGGASADRDDECVAGCRCPTIGSSSRASSEERMIHLARVRYLTCRFDRAGSRCLVNGAGRPGNSAPPHRYLRFDRPASRRRCRPRSGDDIGSRVQTAAVRSRRRL